MRIRKNANLSSILGLSSASHVCQLNQSPWDVIPFSSSHDVDPFPPPPAATTPSFLHHPLDGDDSLTGNASFGDSLGAVDSGVEMVLDDEDCDIRSWKQEEEAPDDNEDDDNNDNDDDDQSYNYRDETAARGVGMITRGGCKWTSGKGRQCSREAEGGQYLCERHLKPHHNADINSRIESPAASSTRKGRRGRPPRREASAKSRGANNSNQFYYYSGFGPSWGRRRTGRGGNVGGAREESMVETGGESSGRSSATPPPPPASGRIDNIGEEADYAVVYDYEEEDEESSGGDRKRTRKPVKARSLKSLM